MSIELLESSRKKSITKSRLNRRTGCLKLTGKTISGKSVSMPTAKWLGCSLKNNWITRAPTLKRKPFCWPRSRMKPGMVSTCIRLQNAGHHPRRNHCRSAQRQSQILSIFQLSDARLGRHRRHWMAGRWRWDYEPGLCSRAHVLYSLCPRHGTDLRKTFISVRGFDILWVLANGSNAENHVPGRHQPLVVARPDDVRPHDSLSTHSDQSMKWKDQTKKQMMNSAGILWT